MNTTLSLSRPGLRWLAGGLSIGLLVASLAAPAVVTAQSTSDVDATVRTISVSGTGRVKAEPDVADISLGVTKQGKEAGEASTKAAETPWTRWSRRCWAWASTRRTSRPPTSP